MKGTDRSQMLRAVVGNHWSRSAKERVGSDARIAAIENAERGPLQRKPRPLDPSGGSPFLLYGPLPGNISVEIRRLHKFALFVRPSAKVNECYGDVTSRTSGTPAKLAC